MGTGSTPTAARYGRSDGRRRIQDGSARIDGVRIHSVRAGEGPDLPEWFVDDGTAGYLRYVLHSRVFDPTTFGEDELAIYARAYSRPGVLRGRFEHYWTCFGGGLGEDLEDLEPGRHGAAPVRMLSRDAGDAIPDCGHYLPEECPEAVLAQMQDLLAG